MNKITIELFKEEIDSLLHGKVIDVYETENTLIKLSYKENGDMNDKV